MRLDVCSERRKDRDIDVNFGTAKEKGLGNSMRNKCPETIHVAQRKCRRQSEKTLTKQPKHYSYSSIAEPEHT